jgi:N-acetylglucosamine-6-phosphate deacetylase
MVRVVKRSSSATLPEVIRMATQTPARRAGLQDRGSLEAGALADLVRLDTRLRVRGVFLGGESVAGKSRR